MDVACPVISSFLSQVHKYMGETTVLVADAYEHHLYLLEEALHQQRFRNTVARQHQRAFLSVEWMLYRLPAHLPTNTTRQLEMSPWPRSREGLTNLIRMLRGDHEELVGVMTEYTFARGMVYEPSSPGQVPVRVGDGADQIYQSNRESLQDVYRFAGESAVILRQALRNPNVKLTRIGTRLARSAIAARVGMAGLLELAELLMTQSENNAPRAWEIPLT